MNDNQTAAIMGALLAELVVFLLIGVLFAIGNAGIAGRLGRNKALWAILSLIPVINFIFMYYVIYQVIYGVLDRLPLRRDQA